MYLISLKIKLTNHFILTVTSNYVSVVSVSVTLPPCAFAAGYNHSMPSATLPQLLSFLKGMCNYFVLMLQVSSASS